MFKALSTLTFATLIIAGIAGSATAQSTSGNDLLIVNNGDGSDFAAATGQSRRRGGAVVEDLNMTSIPEGAKDAQRSRGDTTLGDVVIVRELDKSSTKLQE